MTRELLRNSVSRLMARGVSNVKDMGISKLNVQTKEPLLSRKLRRSIRLLLSQVKIKLRKRRRPPL